MFLAAGWGLGPDTSYSKGRALADATQHRAHRALLIFAAQRRTAGIAEVEFSQLAVQVVLGAVLIDAARAALEGREIAPIVFVRRLLDVWSFLLIGKHVGP